MRLKRNQLLFMLVSLPALLVTLASFFFLLTNETQRRSDLNPAAEFNSLGIAAHVSPRESGNELGADGAVYVSPLRPLTNEPRSEISEQAAGDTVSPWKLSALKNFAQPTPFQNLELPAQSQASTSTAPNAQPSVQAPAPVEPTAQPQAASDDNSGKSDDDNSGKSDDDNSGKSDDGDNSGKSDDGDNSGKSDDDNSGTSDDDNSGKSDDGDNSGKSDDDNSGKSDDDENNSGDGGDDAPDEGNKGQGGDD